MKKDYGKYLFAMLLFSSNGIVANQIALKSYEVVFLKTGIGCLSLLLLFLLSRQKWQAQRHPKELVRMILSGMAMGASSIFLYEAYRQIGVGLATILYYCGSVFVMASAPIFFHERLTLRKWLGLAAVLAGVVCINGQAFQAGKTAFGLFCGLMSAVMFAVMVISTKKVEHIPAMEKASLQMLVSFLPIAAYLCFKQGLTLEIPMDDLPMILLLGLVNTGVGYYCCFSAMGKLPVQTVAVCGYLEPLSAVLLSAVLLGEAMSGLQLLGAALILGGAIFAELSGKKKEEKKTKKFKGTSKAWSKL